jgi:hypothetical protein
MSMSMSSSPPRTKAVRPFQARQTIVSNGNNDKGWNDPPSGMFNQGYGELSASASGGLTPSGSIHGAGTGFEPPLSRKSSRVNLHEMGLAQRSASRAGTPFE